MPLATDFATARSREAPHAARGPSRGSQEGQSGLRAEQIAANAAIIARADAAGCTEGWQYNAAGTEAVLCSQTCQTIKADTTLQVEVFGGCASITSIIK